MPKIKIDDKVFDVNPEQLLRKAHEIDSVFKSMNETGRINCLKQLATITFLATHIEDSELLDQLEQIRKRCVQVVSDSYDMSIN